MLKEFPKERGYAFLPSKLVNRLSNICFQISIADGRILFLNKAFSDVTGYAVHSLPHINDIFAKILEPKGRWLALRAWLLLRRKRLELPFELPIFERNGLRRWMQVDCNAIIGEDGEISVLEGILTDISRYKENERSYDRFKKIIDQANYGAGVIDINGTIIYNNEYLARMVGYEQNELNGYNIAQILALDSKLSDLENLSKLRSMGNISSQEVSCKRKDGSMMPALLNAVNISDDRGQRRFYSFSLIDIIELKQAESALRLFSLRYAAILKAVPDIIIECNLNRELIWANPAGFAFFGEGILGQKVEDIYVFLPEAQNVKQQLINLYNFRIEMVLIESRHENIDGISRILEWGMRRIENEQGSLIGIIMNAHDITDRKMTQRALSDSEQKWRTLGHNAPMRIMTLDKKGIIHFINKDTKNHSINEIIGHSIYKYIKGNNRQLLKKTLENISADSRPQKIEFMLAKKNGRKIWNENIIAPVAGSKGETLAILISMDITRRKEVESILKKAKEKAEEADRVKSSFLASMSHEIRTPLNSIIGYTDLLLERSLDADVEESMRMILNSSQHLLSIINDILDISKIEADQLLIESIPFNLKEMVNDLYRSGKAIISQKKINIDLRLFYSDQIGDFIYGDTIRLNQVLLNLLTNAIKFTQHGFIELGVSLSEDARLEFYVRDTGIGIPESKQSEIFLPFKQADATVTRRYGGTGLGLAISRKLIALMGGELKLRSNIGLEHGSTFYFAIDYKKAEPLQVKKIDQKYKSKYSYGNKILVVEDNMVNQTLVKKILEKEGFEVIIAKDGREGISKFKADNALSMILMDIQMPVLDGLAATKKIRQIEDSEKRTKRIPIIALTAAAMSGEREKCYQAGCNEYLTKPIIREKFLETMDKYLQEK